jgi:hypothetical protein
MAPSDKEIQTLVQKLFRADFTPRFEQVWTEAEKRVVERKSRSVRSRSPYALGALAALTAAIAVVIATTARHEQKPTGQREAQTSKPSLAELTDPGSWSAPLDRISARSATDSLPMDGLLQREEKVVNAATDNSSSEYDQYGCPTDFLLNIDIPAWNKTGERHKL